MPQDLVLSVYFQLKSGQTVEDLTRELREKGFNPLPDREIRGTLEDMALEMTDYYCQCNQANWINGNGYCINCNKRARWIS
jgi:hypothetical protein